MQPTSSDSLPFNQVLQGDCNAILDTFPPASIDLIFADPPYNLQLNQELYRPNQTRVAGVDDEWDQFDSFQAYDEFSRRWLGLNPAGPSGSSAPTTTFSAWGPSCRTWAVGF